ncbi:LSM4 homolog U6 small nuclear RNA and mRNA degradation associated [Cricetulus griseus]
MGSGLVACRGAPDQAVFTAFPRSLRAAEDHQPVSDTGPSSPPAAVRAQAREPALTTFAHEVAPHQTQRRTAAHAPFPIIHLERARGAPRPFASLRPHFTAAPESHASVSPRRLVARSEPPAGAREAVQRRKCLQRKMLPLSLLKTAQNHPMLVELKNGETYNGHLVSCDNWMNINLREVICTSRDGDKFWRMPECYIRGSTIKYLRIPDEIIDMVREEAAKGRGRGGPQQQKQQKGRGMGGAGRGVFGGRGRGGIPGAGRGQTEKKPGRQAGKQ